MSNLDMVFRNLDEWSRLPNYQLERRADIFFSLYLHEVIDKALRRQVGEVGSTFIPEFPVRHERTNRSDKIDYLGATKNGCQLILVELKTSQNALRRAQVKYLIKAAKTPHERLIADLSVISAASRSRDKYSKLLKIITDLKLPEAGENSALVAHHVVLIQPTDEVEPWVRSEFIAANVALEVIAFAFFAEVVAQHNDPLSRRFAESLLDWAKRSPSP